MRFPTLFILAGIAQLSTAINPHNRNNRIDPETGLVLKPGAAKVHCADIPYALSNAKGIRSPIPELDVVTTCVHKFNPEYAHCLADAEGNHPKDTPNLLCFYDGAANTFLADWIEHVDKSHYRANIPKRFACATNFLHGSPLSRDLDRDCL